MGHSYEERDGWERARLYIACTPRGWPATAVGTYLQQDSGPIMSPVCVDGAALYPWINRRGWTEVPGIESGILYERPIPLVHDPAYLEQTARAVAAYDAATPGLVAQWMTGDTGEMQGAMLQEEKYLEQIREAFARDTADRNSRDHAYLVDCGRLDVDGKEGRPLSFARLMVERWQKEQR